VRYGAAEGLDPHPLFDTDWYLARHPDVRLAAVNPLEHYMRFGAAEDAILILCSIRTGTLPAIPM
jgi:hypothetical protein